MDAPTKASGGYAIAGGASSTGKAPSAFREAEKKYQLHYDQELKFSKGKLRGKRGRLRERPTDLSEVLDFRSPPRDGDGVVVDVAMDFPGNRRRTVRSLARHPGFYHVESYLTCEECEELAREILETHIDPPASSNHTARHGDQVSGLWAAAGRGDAYDPESGRDGTCWSPLSLSPSGSGVLTARTLLERLRWVSLGPRYDWTRREYLRDSPHRELPRGLKAMADGAVASLCAEGGGATSSMSTFGADAALVNFYGAGDTLGGHVDDAEADLAQPLVSLSLGCDAVFLLGGRTREERPTAMLLRSGDLVVMSGDARRCYHGLPRILSSREPMKSSRQGAQGGGLSVEGYLAGHRINVSVRMVAEPS